MAQTVSHMLEQIRVGLADEDGHRFTDASILPVLNRAARRAYRRIVSSLPDMVAVVFEGTVTDGNEMISFAETPMRILAFYINGTKIPEVAVGSARKLPAQVYNGPPSSFSLVDYTGQDFVYDGETYTYRIIYVPSMTVLTTADSTTWIDDVDDVLVEYVTARMGIIDEGDASQEMSIMAELDQSLDEIFANYVPRDGVVWGYWDAPAVRSDY